MPASRAGLRQRLGKLPPPRSPDGGRSRRHQLPHAFPDGVAWIDRLLRPQGGVEQRIEDLGRRPAGFFPPEFAQQIRRPPQAAAAGSVAVEGIEFRLLAVANVLEHRRRTQPLRRYHPVDPRPQNVTAYRVLLRIVVHFPEQHDAAAADRAPHLHDQLLQRTARARVARDGTRLVTLEYLADEEGCFAHVPPLHISQRRAVMAVTGDGFSAGGDHSAQSTNESSREQAAHSRSGLAGRPFCSRIRLTKRVKR